MVKNYWQFLLIPNSKDENALLKEKLENLQMCQMCKKCENSAALSCGHIFCTKCTNLYFTHRICPICNETDAVF